MKHPLHKAQCPRLAHIARRETWAITGRKETLGSTEKLADVFDTTIDFLISGDKDEKVKASLKDAELLQQFKAVEQFTDDDKTVVKKLIDAFIVKKQLQQMAS